MGTVGRAPMTSVWMEDSTLKGLALEADVEGLIAAHGPKAWSVADSAVLDSELPAEMRQFYLTVRNEIEKRQGRGLTADD